MKPGGLLVYITCSVFDEENGGAGRGVPGASMTALSPVDHRALWDSRFPGHAAAARIDAAGGISLSPALSGTDGFYFCALRKAG